MKTKFNLTVHIDDEAYEVTYSFATPKQKEELEALDKADAEAVENYKKLNDKLEMLESKRITNAELIPLLEGPEKLEVLKEQRILLPEIEKLTPKVQKAAAVELNNKADEKRFEYLISGKDKDKLQADAKKNNFPMQIVMGDILKALAKSKEKK